MKTKFMFIFLCLTAGSLYGAKPFYLYFKNIGIKEGLSQAKVQTMVNDHNGYLWVGTRFGLNRYNGSQVTSFFHIPQDSTSLPSDNIIFVTEDAMGQLWVSTQSGLCTYDRLTGKFIHQQIGQDSKQVFHCFLNQDDGLLIGGNRVIYRLDYKTKHWEELVDFPSEGVHTVSQLLPYKEHYILVNTLEDGVFVFSSKEAKLKRIPSLDNRNYTCFYTDSLDRLWYSIYGKGIYCYENGKVTHHFSTTNSALTNNDVLDITIHNGKLWIATDGGGINILSLKDFTFSNINRVTTDPYSFPSQSINKIYCDLNKDIWIGTVDCGVVGLKKVYYHTFRNVPFGNPYGISAQKVTSFLQDGNGCVWIGTDGGGINQFDVASNTFIHYPQTQGMKITSIAMFSSEQLLFFCYNKGFFLLNKFSGAVTPFEHIDHALPQIVYYHGIRVKFCNLSDNLLMISSKKTYLYNLSTRKLQEIGERGRSPYAPSFLNMNDSCLYMLEGNHTLYRFHIQSQALERFRVKEYDIQDACVDSSGICWLGTTKGLVRYDMQRGVLHPIFNPLFRNVRSVTADHRNQIWIGTHKSVFVYSIQADDFFSLSENDGITPNEYLSNVHLLLQNGDILMGGMNGIAYLQADITLPSLDYQRIKLQEMLLNGTPQKWENDSVPIIRIPWNFSSLQLHFILERHNLLHQDICRFWIDSDEDKLFNSRQLNFHYLPVGQFTLWGSYHTLKDGWSQKQKVAQLIITPPWWKTIYFFIFIFLFICGMAIMVIYHYENKKQKKQKRKIEEMKVQANQEKVNFLIHLNHELRTPLSLICAPLQRIINREVPDEKVPNLLTRIYQQTKYVKSILDMMLDVYKLKNEKDALSITAQPLNEWLRNVVDKFAMEIEARHIQMKFVLDDKIGMVSFDSKKCEFVVDNFLMNALKYSQDNATITIRTTSVSEHNTIRVSVQNQGNGLQFVNPDSLFEEFYQGTNAKDGYGIGLAYAKQLIAYHKGYIGATDHDGKNAIFFFELPLNTDMENSVKLPSATLADPEEKKSTDYHILHSYLVIIVENDPDLRAYLKEVLEEYFQKVLTAKDGREGLELIEKWLPDIVISDVKMPQIDGFELCRRVKTNLNISHIPFILLTAYNSSSAMNIGYKTGADAFLPKPFDVDTLLSVACNRLKFRETIRMRYKDSQSSTIQDICFSHADETFLISLNKAIQESLNSPELNVNYLANKLCISRSLLFHKIKSITGMGIVDYVNQQKIEKATLLLTTTNKTITEIAEEVGFSTLKYFTKVFKSIKEVSPSAYRKNIENKHVETDRDSE